MKKIKAIVVTTNSRVYNDFIRKNKLNQDEYPLVSNKAKLYGYRDTVAFLLMFHQEVMGNGIEFGHTEALLKIHNIDTFYDK